LSSNLRWKQISDPCLVSLMTLEGFFGPWALRWMTPIVSGQTDRSQWDAVAALGTVVVIVLQCNERYARLVTTLGTGHKCFTSCHTRISFLSRAYAQPEKAFSSETHSQNRLDFSLLCSEAIDWTSKHSGTTFESSFAWLDKLIRRGELI
jgi:hypothetical protein